MKWEDITPNYLIETYSKKYPEFKFKGDNNSVEGKLKNIVLELWITETTYDIWKSNILVHVGISQRKGILRGNSCAVDNFEDLDIEIEKCIKTGQEWLGEIRKKLV